MSEHPDLALALADAFLAGDLDPPFMVAQARERLGPRLRTDVDDGWLDDLAREVAEAAPSDLAGRDPQVARATLADLIRRCDHFEASGLPAARASVEAGETARVQPAPSPPRATRRPPALPLDLPIEPLRDRRDVREWLGLSADDLDWYADVRSFERMTADGPLRHYRYRWTGKRTGGARLLEAPKPMLRFFQRRILHELLDPIPVHPAAHGFRAGRSVHSFAAPHAGADLVIRADLVSFFASVRPGRVFRVFTASGHGPGAAHALTGLVTNTVPLDVRRGAPRPAVDAPDHRARLGARRDQLLLLGRPHLPQGAPSSPALANLVAFRLDRRLAGLARSFGATYTRYADDLALSGARRLASRADRLLDAVAAIAAEEGFALHPRKTRVMPAGGRQALAGLVVNARPQVARATYDELRAVLHDAARHGPATANRTGHPDFRAHLLGRIGWVGSGSPARAAKLHALFARIDW